MNNLTQKMIGVSLRNVFKVCEPVTADIQAALLRLAMSDMERLHYGANDNAQVVANTGK